MTLGPPPRRRTFKALFSGLVRGFGATTPLPDQKFARSIHAPLTATAATIAKAPLVSVVMTCHDTERHVDAAVDSILAQSWERLELIVVDDASTDGSLGRLRALAALDERVRIISLPSNIGTYRAKNIGLRSARGDVLTFMDSDDTSHPERIEQQLEPLRRRGITATTCNYFRHTSAGDLVLNRGLRERRALISLMVKRQVIDDIGWFDSVRTSADDEYFERIRLTYGRDAVAHVNKALYMALVRENSLSTTPDTGVRLDASANEGLAPLSDVRQAYVESYRDWYARLGSARMRPYMPDEFTPDRPFPADPRLIG